MVTTKRPISLSYWAIGDSITGGAAVTVDQRFTTLVNNNLKSVSGRNTFYVNHGFSGWKSAGMLPFMRQYVHSFDPDIVTILLGANDVGGAVDQPTFNANLTAMIRAIQGAKLSGACDIYLLQMCPRFDAYAGSVAPYNATIATVAQATGVNLVDLTTAYPDASYTADNLHPNVAGNQSIANIINNAINARSGIWNV